MKENTSAASKYYNRKPPKDQSTARSRMGLLTLKPPAPSLTKERLGIKDKRYKRKYGTRKEKYWKRIAGILP